MVVGPRAGAVAANSAVGLLTLALAIALFVSPLPYGVLTIVFTVVIAALVALAEQRGDRPVIVAPRGVLGTAIGAACAIVIAIAGYRWVALAVSLPYHADMLIVIREATRRFLNGHNPYTIYRAYDAPWDMAMPYGPLLWGPFVGAQLLRLDFRLLTIAGELFVPAWCGIAAVVDATRGRVLAALSWVALLGALLAAIDLQHFTLIGHTPVYWPLFPLLAWTVARQRWTAAACLLGLLVLARTTMVAAVPTLLMAVFIAERRKLPVAILALGLTIGAGLVPFIIWGPHALWDSMVLSYPRVMKAAVWPVLARPGLETIGLTEWILERHGGWLVVPVQIGAMVVVYMASWIALDRGRPPVPWMALALFVFSMTSLYPVHYLYYDVLLLLASAALAETLDPAAVPRLVRPWVLSLIAVGAVPLAVLHATVSPWPRLVAGQDSRYREFRTGFSPVEYDGGRPFSWIVGTTARIVIPRSSADDGEIVLTAESPFGEREPPQRLAAILNGVRLADMTIPPGRREIHLRAPRATWWIGFNDLQLTFSSTVVPREAGGGDDSRPLALSLSRLDVIPPRP